MQQLPAEYRLVLARELRARQAREAADARLATGRRPRRLRTTVGLTLVSLGQRLAAEPRLQPVRPR
jgi:hypothetical protein